MEISVIICTYNRIEGLIETLKSLEKQKLSDNIPWEVVIVDNNSIDGTYSKVKEYINISKLNINCFREKTQGLSHARNKGILMANGKYLLFIDDDELADKNLVLEIYNTFMKYDCDCVGGRIYLQYETEMPKWLKKELWGFLTFLDYGDAPIVMDRKRYPFGGNMAFKSEVFKNIGNFDVSLGRNGKKLIGGEEVDLFKRLLDKGGKGIYQPNALIYHVTSNSRFKKNYFRTLHYYNGYKNAFNIKFDSQISLIGVSIKSLVNVIKNFKDYFSVILLDGWENSFRKELSICWDIGYIHGCLSKWNNINRKVTNCRKKT